MKNILGPLIRRAREREGLKQADLAAKIGVTPGAISNWESGTSHPTSANKHKLEEILGKLSKRAPEASSALDVKESEQDIHTGEVSSFGIWVRDQRLKATLTVPELAKLANISIASLYNLENGKIQNPQAATRDKLADALKTSLPKDVVTETENEQEITGLGSLIDFDPYSKQEWPQCCGVYVLYDVSQRPIYVGKATSSIACRIKYHFDKFWFKDPIVRYGSYIEVKDKKLCYQLEQALIKFLKSNAVVNKQSSERFDED